MFILAIAVVVSAAGGGKKKTPSTSEEVSSSPFQEELIYDKSFQGILKEMDTSLYTITVTDINTGLDNILTYTGASGVRDKYDKEMTMAQLEIGEIVDVCYIEKSSKLVKIEISDEAWEYKGVGNLKINRSDKTMKISDSNYKYEDKTIVVSNNELIGLIDINEKDELTVKGIDEKIYSIIVTKGHGYIRFVNYEQFIGGNIEVGNNIMTQVTENMLVVAREGNYKVSMGKDGLSGSKNVNVMRDEEIIIDMGDFMPEAKQKSLVEFKIAPSGAELYIDGKFRKYNKDVELEYGEYLVKVVLEGYDTFAGLLDVDKPTMTIEINLAEPVEDEEDTDIKVEDTDPEDEATESPEATDTPSSSKSPSGTSTKVDYSHSIYVEKPIGAEVYLNGKFKGIAPLSFPKEIGNHTITLRSLGHETKSYSVVVEDDSKDNHFVFESLEITSLY